MSHLTANYIYIPHYNPCGGGLGNTKLNDSAVCELALLLNLLRESFVIIYPVINDYDQCHVMSIMALRRLYDMEVQVLY